MQNSELQKMRYIGDTHNLPKIKKIGKIIKKQEVNTIFNYKQNKLHLN